MAIRKVKPGTCVRIARLSRRHRGGNGSAKRLLIVSIVAYMTASCATTEPGLYVEPPLPDDETAWFLVLYPQSLWSRVGVHKIDDMEIRYTFPFQGSWSRITWSLKVAPGEHQIEGFYISTAPFQGRRALVSFLAEFDKGRSYSIFARSDDDEVQMWVEDTETKEVVGIGTVALEDD